jgi:hypothetical protein
MNRQAAYEKAYRKYDGMDGPRIVAARADVDIFPERRAAEIRGVYTLKNKTAGPIDRIHITFNPDVLTKKLELPGSAIEMEDRDLGYVIRTPEPPSRLPERDTAHLRGVGPERGLRGDRRANEEIVGNGNVLRQQRLLSPFSTRTSSSSTTRQARSAGQAIDPLSRSSRTSPPGGTRTSPRKPIG